MRKLYIVLSQILDSVDFEKLWPGFKSPRFALYDDKNVYFEQGIIPYDTRFLGNTCIDYEGDFIAIWKVDEPEKEDAEILAANVVHEMFHAFQRSMGESRYPNDLLMLNYPDAAEIFQIKYLENTLLAGAYLEEDITVKKALFTQFMSTRKYRKSLLGDIIRCEYLIETTEGMADYAGVMALKQISPGKYLERMQNYIRILQSPGAIFTNTRMTYYIVGAIICIVAGQAQMNLYHNIHENQKTVFEILSDGISHKPVKKLELDSVISKKLTAYIKTKQQKIAAFLKTHHKRAAGHFVICGYDPMNMIKSENRILCSHFVMLYDTAAQKQIQIISPVLLEMQPDTIDEVIAYIT